jgi:hypothetical protein
MHVTSKSGRLYIIDDFSSYVTVWSISLRSKDDAAVAIKVWQRLTENLSGARLKYLVTDNCELLSKSVSDWCDELDIEHHSAVHFCPERSRRASPLDLNGKGSYNARCLQRSSLFLGRILRYRRFSPI